MIKKFRKRMMKRKMIKKIKKKKNKVIRIIKRVRRMMNRVINICTRKRIMDNIIIRKVMIIKDMMSLISITRMMSTFVLRRRKQKKSDA